MKIAIVDLGIGNLRSVAQAVKHVAPASVAVITHDAEIVESADKVILPGQGAVGSWFKALDQRGLRAAVEQACNEKPLLGICVGMQALFRYCEEDGGQQGLDIFPGEVRHFRHFHDPDYVRKKRLKIPQMGWNQVYQTLDHPMWQGINNGSYFYFLHSYCANLDANADQSAIAGEADYAHRYVAAITRQNVFATQFHPEKSHNDGLQLIRNFCGWNGQP